MRRGTLAKILRLPEDKQEVAAELLEQLAGDSDPYPYPLSDDERDIVREPLARARPGELAEDEQVDAALRQP